jgi:hypothetical protein
MEMKMLTREQVPGAIVSAAKRLGTVQKDVHRILCSIAYDLNQHGHWPSAIGNANKLVAELGDAIRKEAIKAWAKTFLAMEYGKEDETVEVSCFYRAIGADKKPAAHQGIDVKKGIASPFYGYTAEPVAKPFDLLKYLEAGLKKADNHAKRPIAGDIIPAEVLEVLRKIAA